MSSQKLICTALPNGKDSTGNLRLSVYLSPQLSPGPGDPADLSTFPDWWNWPSNLPSFKVLVDTPAGPVTVGAKPDPAGSTPDSTLWQALFDKSTPVRPYAYTKLDDRQIRSYRALGLHDYLRDRYQSVATTNASDFPSANLVGEMLQPLLEIQVRSKSWDYLKAEKVPPAGEAFEPHRDFFRFQLFHQPTSTKQMPLEVPKLDFHDMVGSLAHYPAMMRQMGLVLDLVIAWQRNLPAAGRLRLAPVWQPRLAQTKPVTPWTHYTLGDAGHPNEFMAQSQPSNSPEFLHGKLPLADGKRYGIIQMNVDSLSFKALNLALELPKLRQSPFQFPRAAEDASPNGQQTPSASLPAAGTTGLNLVRVDQAAATLALMAAGTQHHASVVGGAGDGTDMDLYLEDLVRGQRLDVWDDTVGAWYSLHERVGTYTAGAMAPTEIADEGWSMLGAAATSDPTAADQALRIHESVAEWAGWSLSAPRPESVISPKETIQDQPGTPVSTYRLKATFTAKAGSLPRLRFGRKYRLLARTADLAGNGPDHADDRVDPGAISPPVVYRRYEPITQPVLIPRTPYKDSESIEHLVVRTWTTPPPGTPVTEPAERHVAPPVTTVRMAETHGVLDDPAGPGGWRVDTYKLLSEREGSAPSDPVPDPQWRLNYLADPAARGAAFVGLPGAAGVQQCAFDTAAWPDYRPFRIRAQSGSGAPTWPNTGTAGDRALVVNVPPAVVARVRLSSYPDKGQLITQMGAWRWVMGTYNPGDPETPPVGNATYDQLLQTAAEGRHWMVTPYREIQLIHAVQQPLVAPKFSAIAASRGYGNTFAVIRYVTLCNGKSTQKCDVSATWPQNIDDVTKDGPETVHGSAHAFTTPVTPDVTTLAAAGRHEFGDTKHRYVSYAGTFLTRFPEFFPPGTAPLDRTTEETGGPTSIHVPSSARPAVPEVLFVLPVFEWVPGASDQYGGQVMVRKGNAVRVYLDRPWYSSGDDEKLAVVLGLRPKPGTVWLVDYANEMTWKYNSGWGLDPIVTTGPVSSPLTADHFALAGAPHDQLTLEEVPGGIVTAVPHEVHYDLKQQLWYCDIRVEPDPGSSAYWPFVRLALARYQPYSIAGAHLSRIARADFVQLTADRSVSVTPGSIAGVYNVSLFGQHGHVAGVSAPWRRVEVTVERQDPSGEAFGWTPVGAPVALTAFFVPSLYIGRVRVPSAPGTLYRLVFKEYEKLLTDAANRSLTGAPSEAWRLIFAHAFTL